MRGNHGEIDLPEIHAEVNDEEEHGIQWESRMQEFPKLPRKTLYTSLLLTFFGILFIIAGFVEDISMHDPGKGISFWVIGALVSIPGFYYTAKFYQAWMARSPEERQHILDEVPDL
mmetsp:Transcript_10722/g.11680  ORF Transcript_10722/g.11680 Transcript_10722/m.11680 type:complete len:116 (-) Transcript_10722:423-770(-)